MMSLLTPEVRAFLTEPHFGVLATIGNNGLPQQTVVWYEVLGDEILMNTRRGRSKDRNMLRDPRVSLCVADGYRAVTLVGQVTLDEDQATAHRDIERLAVRYDGAEEAARRPDRWAGQTRVTARLRVERVVPYGLGRGEG
jgi:PPOX class probable F420-dependent enzyme